MLTQASAPSTSALDSPRAWIVVAGAFLVSFVSWGVTYSFGVFLKPMASEFHARHLFVTALFSTVTVVSCLLTPLTGKIADRFGPRPLTAVGAVLMGVSLLLTAQANSLPILFLTYGVGAGAALACTYVPGMAAVGQWFKAHRTIAMGIAISGVGCGTLVGAPVSAVLVDRYGWRRAFEVFGWSSAAILLFCAVLLFRPPRATEKKHLSIASAVRTRAFFFLYASLLFARMAVYICMVYLPAFADDSGIARVPAAALVGYIGAASIVGRLGFNGLAPRFGLLSTYRLTYAVMFVSFFLWLAGGSYLTLLVFAIVMGVGYGGVAAMYAPVTASIFGVERLGQLLGILFTGTGLGSLLGLPLASVLVDDTRNYHYPVVVALAAAGFAFALVLPLRKHALASTRAASAAAAG